MWDKEESLNREELQAIQLERLQATVKRTYERVPYYRELLDEQGVTPADIRSLEDVRLLPFTTKDVLREQYPYGLFAVPLEEIVRLHASSGTTGKPTVVGYTKQDLKTWANLIARIVTMAGVERRDIAQICFGYGLFTGAFGLHYGLEEVGVTIVPASTGNSEKQIMLMQDFGTTVLVSTPSYALYLAEVARGMGVEPRSLGLRIGLFGSEPWSEEIRQQIEAEWGLFATDNYGLSEVMGPGVAGECQARQGLHINEDHFLVELINPETGEPVGPGEQGELVFTPLTKEALPILRYRTRDLATLDYAPCACGRTLVRMSRVCGRSDDMLVIRGVNVFPTQVESVLLTVPAVAPHYQLVVRKKGFLDDLEVRVELKEEYFTDDYKKLVEIEEEIRHKLQNVLSIGTKVTLAAPGSIERFTGKARRVLDLRQEGKGRKNEGTADRQ
ncbi:phenylacetate--CoA ligase family protein [Carboxydocella sp. JDF658]|uniref:phenylacetate--CoA ligase family protein n=1 Tax=Carboxydocella sp. JDF658 TaxID=1926600 RepID=UPI0009AC1442|nr:phenylacetate--CoA ligase [Carboxydocella sp. JDF658]GAW30892.1 phenylacetate--CoA ligase [Carboxydocella sp. JDF658]